VDKPVRTPAERREAIAAYKAVLKTVLDQRPSGMRNRIAEALGKNRSFVSQITNPAYDTPIPSSHVATIFEICHFSADDRRRFLDAYEEAHAVSDDREPRIRRMRSMTVKLPDFGDEAVNSSVERLLQTLATEIGRTFARDRRRK
jgi:hypothetical protein